MARPNLRDRQITIYLPTTADVARWKELSSASPDSLSRWIFLNVEANLEAAFVPSPPSVSADDIAALQRENRILRAEVAKLEEKQTKYAQAELDRASNQNLPVDLNVVSLLLKGGCWTAPNLAKELQIRNREEAESVNNTLEQFEQMGLIKKSARGYSMR